MKFSIHLTEKVPYKWPIEYWVELIHHLTKKGHEVYAVSDEPHVEIKDENPLLFDRLHLSDDLSKIVIAQSDAFVGAPLKYFHMAVEAGVKTVVLQGPSFKGEGVKTSVQCGGCIENIENVQDCIWEDYLCLFEITPYDVLEYLNAL
jgi:ADP-heptose:LPS heptosyltransferase